MPATLTRPASNRGPLVMALTTSALCLIAAIAVAGSRQGALFVVGALLGISLYHASFGFTSAWRRFLVNGEGRGLRAQMIMLALAVSLFFPVLAAGEIFGQSVWGFVFPVGVSVAIGSFIFGIGMQLGGGCASGTLFTVGGGSTRMVITLIFFVIGSVLGTAHLGWWLSLPNIGAYSFVNQWGLGPAWLANIGLFASIFLATIAVERWRQAPEAATPSGDWLHGPWPILWGAVALALLNFATLVLAGRPWGITSGFALWGAKAFHAAGIDMASWPYWQNQMSIIESSIFLDATSVMNIAIMLGAMIAAALAGRFAPTLKLSRVDVLTAIIGGLMLGYGARLAFGCNIGALFSGIASGSLHGWLWLVCGFLGNLLGTRIRPLVGLSKV